MAAFGQLDGVVATIGGTHLIGVGALPLYTDTGTVGAAVVWITGVVGIVDTDLFIGTFKAQYTATEPLDALVVHAHEAVFTAGVILALSAHTIRLWAPVRNRWPGLTRT